MAVVVEAVVMMILMMMMMMITTMVAMMTTANLTLTDFHDRNHDNDYDDVYSVKV